jgi:hypothetical protein
MGQLRQLWITRFDFLAGALPGRVEPSDIDQVLERRQHFLYIECKRPHQPIPRGQEILFDHLLLGPKSVHVLQVVGNPPDAIESYGWWGKPLRPGNVDQVRTLARRWWDWAGSA